VQIVIVNRIRFCFLFRKPFIIQSWQNVTCFVVVAAVVAATEKAC